MGGDLERSIADLGGSLSAVVDHAESSSRALAEVVSRPPIHLDSSTSTFLRRLDRMTEAAGAELQHLESMTFGTVSFAELLGHCGETLKVYERYAAAIEDRLTSFGYVPPAAEPEVDAEEDEGGGPVSCFGGLRDEDALFEESMSLKNLGLSEACLATLSSEATDLSENPVNLYKKPESTDDGQKTVNIADDSQKITNEAEIIPPPEETNGQGDTLEGSIRASKEEYEQLPPYMKTLASWEELQEAISKLNSYFSGEKTQGSVALNQDDIGTVGLGRKGRSYLLILLKLNQLTMETVDGSIFYSLRKNDS